MYGIKMGLILLVCCATVAALGAAYIYRESARDWLSDQTLPMRQGISRQRNVMVPMRDGVRLSTQLLRPTQLEGPFPTVLIRTTYQAVMFKWQKLFLDHGYAVVVQHTRGRFNSEGEVYSPHGYDRHDGYDTIDWIIQQPWSNGKVGTFGCSYMGETQSIQAAEKHPNHIAMIADGGGGAMGNALGSYGYFGLYENGVFNLASALGWYTAFGAKAPPRTFPPDDLDDRLRRNMGHLPVHDIARQVVDYKTGFDEMVSHSLTDEWWHKEGYVSDTDTFTTAGLHVNTWFDQTLHDTFNLAALMEKNAVHPRAKQQHILIGPGTHCTTGNYRTGKITVGEMEMDFQDVGFDSIFVDWFNYWLKDEPVDLPPKYQYFQMPGPDWANSDEWPPVNSRSYKLYLDELDSEPANRGRLVPAPPAMETYKNYRYDPGNPVPTRGGPICCTGQENEMSGPVDQRVLETRTDVLVYQSDVLQKKLRIVGDVKVYLGVSSSAKDTDFTVKLIDRFPDGRALNLQDGVVRLRYRNSIDTPELAEPDKVYDVMLKLRPIAYDFEPDHQLVLHISSSNFPRLARNLNTGEHEYLDAKIAIANNRVFHGGEFPSYIELPVHPD
jgi:putative CocE/NonD family hydrolase